VCFFDKVFIYFEEEEKNTEKGEKCDPLIQSFGLKKKKKRYITHPLLPAI